MIRRSASGFALQNDPHAAAAEFNLLRHLRSKGLPVATPYHVDESGEIFEAPYLVVEYIDGAPEFSPANLTDFILQFATRLAEIHRVAGVDTGLEFLPKYVPRIDFQRGLLAHLVESLDVARVRDVLTHASPLRPLNQPALLHGDYWLGNVVWKNGQIRGVVDWEEAGVGDPVTDLAISRLDILWAFGIEAMHEFTRRYQSMADLDYSDLALWDLDAALRPAFNISQWASPWPDLGRPDITEATMRSGHAQFVDQALAALRD